MKAGVANGFELQREMEQAFAAQKGADRESGNRREGWRGRALDMAHGLAEALGSMRHTPQYDLVLSFWAAPNMTELQGSLLPLHILREPPGNLAHVSLTLFL